MADEIPMVTSCPLCLAPDEVESMVTVEIERAIPKGRAAVIICRDCTGAVIRAARHADPALLDLLLTEREAAAIRQAASGQSAPEEEPDVAPEGIHPMSEAGFTEIFPCPADCPLEHAGVQHFHTTRAKEEPSDG